MKPLLASPPGAARTTTPYSTGESTAGLESMPAGVKPVGVLRVRIKLTALGRSFVEAANFGPANSGASAGERCGTTLALFPIGIKSNATFS